MLSAIYVRKEPRKEKVISQKILPISRRDPGKNFLARDRMLGGLITLWDMGGRRKTKLEWMFLFRLVVSVPPFRVCLLSFLPSLISQGFTSFKNKKCHP